VWRCHQPPVTYFGLTLCIHGKQSHHATAQFECMANPATEAAEEGGCTGQPGQHRTKKTAKHRTVPSTELPHNLARPTGAIHRFSIRHSSSQLPKIQNAALCAKSSSGLPEALHCHRQPINHCSFRERGSALCAGALPQHPDLAARHPHICRADDHGYMRLTLTCGTHKSQRKQPAFGYTGSGSSYKLWTTIRALGCTLAALRSLPCPLPCLQTLLNLSISLRLEQAILLPCKMHALPQCCWD